MEKKRFTIAPAGNTLVALVDGELKEAAAV